MAAIFSLNYSFNFTMNQNTPRRSVKKDPEFIDNHDPMKQKSRNSIRTRNLPSEFLISKTSLPPQMEDLISCVKRGSVEDALQLFDEMHKRSSCVWNLVIRVLTDNGFFREALDLYSWMCLEGVQADNFTFPFVIKACGGCLDLVGGRKVHSKLFKTGLDQDVHTCNSLISMYAKLGRIEFAKKVFDEMRVRDLVSWNSMINGYILVGDGLSSLKSITQMRPHKMVPDRFTIVSSLTATSLVRSLHTGKEIHALVIKTELERNPMVQTSLIDMYGKCGAVNYAENFFNRISQSHVAAWNAMIGGYALNGQPLESFSCVRKMQENHSVSPDSISVLNLLPSCSQVGSSSIGKSIHGYAIRRGFLPFTVLDTALVDMYGKCGEPRLAELTFDQISQRNLVSRNTMISALVQNGRHRESLTFFWEILNDGLKPDSMTITNILPAYSEVARLREGKQIHGYVIKSGLCTNTFVLNSLTYTYAKCGDIDSSKAVFDAILSKDVVSWNTIIIAYAIHGFGDVSVRLFDKMKDVGTRPNASTFVSLLTSCSVSGMVEEGWKQFVSMRTEYGIDPGIEHYGCMVDLLGRVGDLHGAEKLISEMPMKPTSRIWGSLLAASRRHGDLVLAETAARRITSEEDHDNTGSYVLLANMYAENGRWEDVRRVKSLMESQGLTKTAASAAVDLRGGGTHRFTDQDRSFKETHLVYDVLDIVSRKIGRNPFAGPSRFVPVDFFRRRGKSTDFHSVRLALCFGLVSTSVGEPVLVRKNVRICEDCHRVMKEMSSVTGRELVVGDSKMFHHFRHGRCSCRDYW